MCGLLPAFKEEIMKRTLIRLKSSARKIKQQIDLLVKAKVLERDGHKCVRCGKTERLAASHILPKGKYPRMRFDALNILTLCVGCHIFWWHRSPIDAHLWLEEKYPGLYDRLKVIAAVARKVDLNELLIALQDQTEQGRDSLHP